MERQVQSLQKDEYSLMLQASLPEELLSYSSSSSVSTERFHIKSLQPSRLRFLEQPGQECGGATRAFTIALATKSKGHTGSFLTSQSEALTVVRAAEEEVLDGVAGIFGALLDAALGVLGAGAAAAYGGRGKQRGHRSEDELGLHDG